MNNETNSNGSNQTENPIINGELGVGLLPSRTLSEDHPGHMWLYWTNIVSTDHHHRGFYPNIDEIPEEFQDFRKWKEYFFCYSVPGRIRIDYSAMEWTRRYSNRYFDKKWSINAQRLSRLESQCEIPPGKDSVKHGYYSWNEHRDDWDNCSSWAIKVVNHAMENSGFITCALPKRLKHVKHAIWGD